MLRVRELQVPASTLGTLVYLLQAFELAIEAEDPRFALPWSLREDDSPDVRIVIGDGRRVYVSFARQCDERPTIYGNIDLATFSGGERAEDGEKPPDALRVHSAPSPARGEFGGPEGSQFFRVEVSVTRIAQRLRLDP